jgi:pantoate--beta-alanine ligase
MAVSLAKNTVIPEALIMKIYRTIAELQGALQQVRKQSQLVGLVPTMGNLHAGHLALVRQAMAECDVVLTSIFVNPTQFGPNEDLASYPRTFEADCSALTELACHGIFYPSVEEIYPQGPMLDTRVSVPALSSKLCGSSRPGHFDGVCTVVNKLLNICQPNRAYFGEKDFQQLTIIKHMVSDLNMSTRIISVPTQRADNGLALSSRNNYLSEAQKQQATVIHAALQQTAMALAASEPDIEQLEATAKSLISEAGLAVDYFSICHPETLDGAQKKDRSYRILAAAYLGKIRLIDNLALNLPA